MNTRPDSSTASSQFSLFWTIVSGLIVISCIGLIVWSSSSVSPLDRVEDPDKALERLISRSMEFEYALTQASPWEQQLNDLLMGEDDVLGDAIMEYRELVNYSNHSLSNLYLAILEAEAGRKEEVLKHAQDWQNRTLPFPLFSEFLQTGYLERPSSTADIETLQAHLAEAVPNNWFYSRLAIQLAKGEGNATFELLTREHLDHRASQLLLRNRVLMFTQIGVCVIGLFLMVYFIRRQADRESQTMKIGEAVLPPEWSIHDGVAVLVRGGAITALLLFGLSFLGLNNRLLALLGIVVLYCPILVLAYYLLLPTNLTAVQALGLRISMKDGTRFLEIVLVLWAAGLFGSWGIGLIAGAGQQSFHWSEWFDQNLVWGTTFEVMVTVFEYGVLAPFFEEVIFRGVLFASLRRRFRWEVSALLSALAFSVVHGYGLVGFLTVLWSGLLWAWAYEKTGSLWPGVVAHGINNFLVSLSLVALFR